MTSQSSVGAAGLSHIPIYSAQGSGSGDYTTASITFVDIDAANLVLNVAAVAGDVIEVTFMSVVAGAGVNDGITLSIGGTVVGDTLGLQFTNSAIILPVVLALLHTVLQPEISGGNVLIKPQWKTVSGTINMYNRSAIVRPYLMAKNLLH